MRWCMLNSCPFFTMRHIARCLPKLCFASTQPDLFRQSHGNKGRDGRLKNADSIWVPFPVLATVLLPDQKRVLPGYTLVRTTSKQCWWRELIAIPVENSTKSIFNPYKETTMEEASRCPGSLVPLVVGSDHLPGGAGCGRNLS